MKNILKVFRGAYKNGAEDLQDYLTSLSDEERKELLKTITSDEKMTKEDMDYCSEMVLLVLSSEGGKDFKIGKEEEQDIITSFIYKVLMFDLVVLGVLKISKGRRLSLLGNDEILEFDNREILDNLAKKLGVN
jgi:hypothetical protein